MKKNIIGHMTAPAESTGKRIGRLKLWPKLLCLLLALFIWLLIVNVTEWKTHDQNSDTGITETVES